MAKIFKSISLFVALVAASPLLFGQSLPVVEAAFLPDSIGIGDRVTLSVSVDKDVVQIVGFPEYEKGNFGYGLEIEGESLDTISVDGRRVKLCKNYTMIAFEEGTHDIGAFPILYLDKNITDTLYSAGRLALEVGTFEIDTLTQTIYDIKKQMDAPVLAGEYLGYLAGGILIALLFAVAIYLIRRVRRGRSLFPWRENIVEPPHVVAITELRRLHDQKLWQSGKHKQYYTRMADIIREYIEARFEIGAMEMTSDEILRALKSIEISEREMKVLHSVLKMADLVKFAKQVPDADDNEQNYNNAYYFVENTKLIESAADLESNNTVEEL